MHNGKYGVARSVLGFVQVVGWAGLGGGILLALSASQSSDWLAGLMYGALLGVGGLVQVALAQIGGAIIEVAERSSEIVEELRGQRAKPGVAQNGQPSGAAKKAPPGSSRSLAKVYKGRSIEKTPFGFEVDGKMFNTISLAERYIDQI